MLCLWTPQLLRGQLVTLSMDLGGHRSVYTDPASESYMLRSDGARVRPIAGPLLGLRLGLRLAQRTAPAHLLQFELRAAYSPELVAVRQAAGTVATGQPLITDHTGQTLFLSGQFQVVMPGKGNVSYYVGAGPGRLIRNGPEFQGTQSASLNGVSLSIGVVPYLIKGFDQRAGFTILTDGSHHNFQLSFGVTTGLLSGRKAAP